MAEWVRRREESRSTTTVDQRFRRSEVPVDLVEDFSDYTGSQLRVLPAMGENGIDWYDPAGFLLARSPIPQSWQRLDLAETDFMLKPNSVVVAWQRYV